MKKISVIIPVYNASDSIKTTLNSVINQSIDKMEVICINDGSTDKSSEILNKYSSKHDFIKIINQENMGPAGARNNGILEAEGEYIAFLDADDIYLDNEALGKMHKIAVNNDADMVSANLRKIKQNGDLEDSYDYKNAQFTYFTKETIIKASEYGIPWAFYKNIYKKEFLIKNNITFPDLLRGQDPVFLAEVLTHIEQIYTVPLDFYGYNYSIGGGLNIKLDTHAKIKDYMSHYKKVFNILKDEEFQDTVYNYKKEFIDYLNFRQNINNETIKKILSEEFGDYKYFQESDYGYLIIKTLIDDYDENDEEYDLIKYCLFEESMLEDTFIDIERLQDFVKISKDNDITKRESSFKQLKNIDNYTFEEKRKINGKVDKLKIDIARFIKSNNDILTSNSWKITGFLRSIKNNSGE